MCRLFGFRSNVRERVHQSLVSEKNSLLRQSQEHKDGWGIAYYEQGPMPAVAHGLGPAHQDPEFERVSSLVDSHAVLAHIRLASIGEIALRNTHPFLFGRWAFAHNGTLREFEQYRESVERAIAPHFRDQLRGDTDSERCFHLFLTQLAELGGIDDPPIDRVACALAKTVKFVVDLGDMRDGKLCSTNFLVTDGQLMVATRRQRTLFFSDALPGRRPSEHVPRDGDRLQQWVVSSEELTAGKHSLPVPEDSVIGVTGELVLRTWTFAELKAEPKHTEAAR
jgi:predicted glutamine amidotransferase